MARAASAPKKEISMEEALWKSADKLRGSVEPAEYKHVVLSLFFLKFASDKFEAQRKAISEKYGEKFVDNVAFYTKDNVFFLPEISRWSFIMENAKQDDIALKIDTALYTIEKANPALKGALPDNYYSRLHIDTAKLASLLDEIDKINTGDKENDIISDKEKDYLHFYCAVRSILFKLTKGDAPDISQMNARVRELLEGAIQSDGIEELFETGKHISVDIFSDEYLDKINAIQLPNTKIKVLQRLLSQAIDEYKKVNRIMGMEFSDRLKRVVDEYNNRRRDEAFANEVLDDVAEQLAKLLEELKKEKDSFKGMGIDYEEKAFYDILKAVAKKYEFEYPDDKMIELSKRIKIIVDDKAKYTDWSTRDDIKANLQVDLILLLDEFDYPPVTIDDVYKEVLEQAENFKKYAQ